MHKTPGFILREIGETRFLVPTDISLIHYNKLIELNASAALLYKALPEQEEFTIDDMINILTSHYDVDIETARMDAQTVATAWLSHSLIQP